MKAVQLNFLKVTAVALLVAGCGGGGGTTDGGTASNPPPATGSTTTTTTFVTGAIAGFGSVIVNGVRYDTDSAQVSIEDKPATAGELTLERQRLADLRAASDASAADASTARAEVASLQASLDRLAALVEAAGHRQGKSQPKRTVRASVVGDA